MKLAKYLKKHDLTQTDFGKRFDPPVTQGGVSHWMNGQTITAERAIEIERATKGEVTRHDLRPDIFARETTAA